MRNLELENEIYARGSKAAQSIIAERVAEIAKLKQEIFHMDAWIKKLHDKLVVRDATIAAAGKRIEELQLLIGEMIALRDTNDMRDAIIEDANTKLFYYNQKIEEQAARIAELETQLAQAQRTNITEPDWSQAPEWANFWAMDGDGDTFWYADEPEERKDYWLNPGTTRYVLIGKIQSNWRNTLRSRPQVEKRQ